MFSKSKKLKPWSFTNTPFKLWGLQITDFTFMIYVAFPIKVAFTTQNKINLKHKETLVFWIINSEFINSQLIINCR